MEICFARHKFPFCIVWTPIPILSWICPFIGHMGIATSKGIIRDFAGSYFVSEDEMAFGWPILYKQLSLEHMNGGSEKWDQAVAEASEEYHGRVHNLFCDNCHSHVALALNKMKYANRTDWNMLRLAIMTNFCGKFVGFGGFLKQYIPAFIFWGVITALIIFLVL